MIFFQERKITSTALSSSSTSWAAFLAQPSWCALISTMCYWPTLPYQLILSTNSTTLSTRALSTKSTKPCSFSPKSSTAFEVISAKVGSLLFLSSMSNLNWYIISDTKISKWWARIFVTHVQPIAHLIISKDAKEKLHIGGIDISQRLPEKENCKGW